MTSLDYRMSLKLNGEMRFQSISSLLGGPWGQSGVSPGTSSLEA